MELQEQAPSVAKGLSIRDSGVQQGEQPGPPLTAGKAQAQALRRDQGSGEEAGSALLEEVGSTPLEEAGSSTPHDEEPRQEPQGEPGSEAAGQAEARRPAAEEEGEPSARFGHPGPICGRPGRPSSLPGPGRRGP